MFVNNSNGRRGRFENPSQLSSSDNQALGYAHCFTGQLNLRETIKHPLQAPHHLHHLSHELPPPPSPYSQPSNVENIRLGAVCFPISGTDPGTEKKSSDKPTSGGDVSQTQHPHCPPVHRNRQRVLWQRQAACVRERARMRAMNSVFDILRTKVPYITEQYSTTNSGSSSLSWRPINECARSCSDTIDAAPTSNRNARRISKIDTLRMTIRYIRELRDVLRLTAYDDGDEKVPV